MSVAVGHLMDQADAFKHADLKEVQSLVGESAATLIVICDEVKGIKVREIALLAEPSHRRFAAKGRHRCAQT